MQVREAMTPQLQSISAAAVLQQAAQLMREFDVGMLPVTEADEIVGTITDRDITVRGVAAGLDPATTPLSEIMTAQVIYCHEDDSIEDAAHVMEQHQLRRLLVLNGTGEAVGIIALADLALSTGSRELGGEVLQEVSRPERPH